MAAERLEVTVESRAEWREWLLAHHADHPSIWLVTWKKHSGGPYVSYEEIVLEALCFGWIDGQARGVDAERTSILLSPRQRGSGWSRINKERIERLHAEGLFHPAGLAVIGAAKADGSWTKLDDVEAGIEPPDLRAALDADAEARAAWDAKPPSFRRGWLELLVHAKTEPTRLKRIAEAIAAATGATRT